MLTGNVDKVVAKAVKLGAAAKGPVMGTFWATALARLSIPEGYT